MHSLSNFSLLSSLLHGTANAADDHCANDDKAESTKSNPEPKEVGNFILVIIIVVFEVAAITNTLFMQAPGVFPAILTVAQVDVIVDYLSIVRVIVVDVVITGAMRLVIEN